MILLLSQILNNHITITLMEVTHYLSNNLVFFKKNEQATEYAYYFLITCRSFFMDKAQTKKVTLKFNLWQ